MPAVSLSRVGARVVESDPGGQELAAGAWQKLEALPDPRSLRGRVYPLACLVAVALCAFTAAGNDRLTAVGQWIRRASQQDLGRLRAPWDPMAGRYRAPDEKTPSISAETVAVGARAVNPITATGQGREQMVYRRLLRLPEPRREPLPAVKLR
jgi:hypothetical protein